MIEVGRLCVKIAGREAGKKCVIVDVLDKNYVLIDGEVRRKKCNMTHLEPLSDVLKLSKGASSSDVGKEFKKLGLSMLSSKPKKTPARPKQIRAADRKKAAAEPAKKAKKPAETAQPKKDDPAKKAAPAENPEKK